MPLAAQQGGAEALLMNFLRHASGKHEYVCTFLEDGPLVAEVQALGFTASVFPATRISDPANCLMTIGRLTRWMTKSRLSAVLSWMPKAHLYSGPAAFLAKVAPLWFQHGIPAPSRINRTIAAIPANGILCCSLAAKVAQDAISPHRPTAVCYPGVSFAQRKPVAMAYARARVGLPLQVPIIGMIARLENWKGAHVFLEAARILAKTQSSMCFFIVGGSHPRDLAYADELNAQAAKFELGNRFLLAGQRPASEVPLWQAAADIIVHPVTGEEPFGMAIVEAMGMGKVVIASDAGGPREIIRPGLDGFLIPRGDASALAARIVQVLDNPEERSSVERGAIHRAEAFTVDAFVKRVDDLAEFFVPTTNR